MTNEMNPEAWSVYRYSGVEFAVTNHLADYEKTFDIGSMSRKTLIKILCELDSDAVHEFNDFALHDYIVVHYDNFTDVYQITFNNNYWDATWHIISKKCLTRLVSQLIALTFNSELPFLEV
jgi:hypothetical protein